MRIIEGNSYVCIKEWKDTKECVVSVGAICYAGKVGLSGYNNEGVYSNIAPMEDYGEHFALYEEAPYNVELRELRERYAGMALQGIISNSYPSVLKHKQEAVEDAIEFANILVEALRKEV